MSKIFVVTIGDKQFVLLGDSMLRRFYDYVKNVKTAENLRSSILCQGGNCISDLIQVITKNYKHNIPAQNAIIMIGTNDLLRVRNPEKAYKILCEEYMHLATVLKKCKFSNIIWLSIPPIPHLHIINDYATLWSRLNQYICHHVVPLIKRTEYLDNSSLFLKESSQQVILTRYLPEQLEQDRKRVHWTIKTIDIVRERIKQHLLANIFSARQQRYALEVDSDSV